MAILVLCQDSEHAQELRSSAKQEHFQYIESIMDELLIAGPTSSTLEIPYDSSCFIYKTDDIEVAKKLLFNDPYYKAGVYSSHSFTKFLPAAGQWINGVIW